MKGKAFFFFQAEEKVSRFRDFSENG